MATSKDPGTKLIASNRNAYRLFDIVEKYEAGIVLRGTEVKSLRDGRVNLKDAHAKVEKGEILLVNLHIAPYSHGTHENHDPLRPRKLLLHRREIRKISIKILERGFSLVPLSLYFRKGIAKLNLGLGKGKKQTDRRREIKDRDLKREVSQALARRR